MCKNLQASGQLPGSQNQVWSFCIPLYLHFHVTSHSRESGVGWRTFQACNWDPQSRAPSCPSFVQLYTPDVGHTPRKTPGAHSPKGWLLSQLLFFDFHHYWFCQCHCLNLGSNLKCHVGWKYDSHILSLFFFMYQKPAVIVFQNMKCKQILQTYPTSSLNCSNTLSKISGHAVIRKENPKLLK